MICLNEDGVGDLDGIWGGAAVEIGVVLSSKDHEGEGDGQGDGEDVRSQGSTSTSSVSVVVIFAP